MPDPLLMARAVGAALIAAAAVFLLIAWPGRPASRAALAAVIGIAAGFYLGCYWLGWRPQWTLREDQERFLLVLFPFALTVELLAAGWPRARRLIWPARLAVAALAAPILLHGSIYLADLAGPDSRAWPAGTAALILAALAAALFLVWLASAALLGRASTALPWCLILTVNGAALAVMLSGYASGGQLGLALAGALAGVLLAALWLGRGPDVAASAVSLGVLGLGALLLIGHCFGALGLVPAALLLAAPLAAWLPDITPLPQRRPRLAGLARLFLVALPVALAHLLLWRERLAEASLYR